MKCPNCQSECEPEWKACPKCGASLASKQLREYKAVKVKTGRILNNVEADDIQKVLNQEASMGWIFDQYITNQYFDKEGMFILVFYKNIE